MKVDVSYVLLPRGTPLPADHAYPVYAAVSRILPEIHQDEDVGIFPICGMQISNRTEVLTPDSRLVLRLDSEKITTVLSLVGKSLQLGKSVLQIGVPSIYPLVPASSLRSRLVTIKGFMEAMLFTDALRRQLDTMEISPDVTIRLGKRRTLHIHGKDVVGFEVFLHGLSDTESLRVQEFGLGGRRKMGCGLFVPATYSGDNSEENAFIEEGGV